MGYKYNTTVKYCFFYLNVANRLQYDELDDNVIHAGVTRLLIIFNVLRLL